MDFVILISEPQGTLRTGWLLRFPRLTKGCPSASRVAGPFLL